MTTFAALRAPREGETPSQTLRHELMTAVLERIARHGPDFVLRGGMVMRAWIAPLGRPTRDLDFVGDFAFDLDDAVRRFGAAIAQPVADGVVIEQRTTRGIWLGTRFPGLHVELAIGRERADDTLGVDIGFRDPLVPAAVTWPCGVRACRPETQLAWKLHGLVEMGDGWRPKDLADLWLLTTRVPLVDADLAPAIDAAFASRGYAVADALTIFDDARWTTKSARVRWANQRGLSLAGALADVRTRLGPVLEALR